MDEALNHSGARFKEAGWFSFGDAGENGEEEKKPNYYLKTKGK